jgi:hypothetical protein
VETLTKTIIQLGQPLEHRGAVLTPLFPRRDPRCHYVSLEEALARGFRVTEVDTAGSVPHLTASNPLDSRVLLYDGEELLGAKQNRVLNVTVLVEETSDALLPVSCVEQGRWRERRPDFAAARHISNPELRQRKAVPLSEAPLAPGIAQEEVWTHVREKANRLGSESPTLAHADTYTARECELRELRDHFPLMAGQSGTLLTLSNGVACLDYLSRPDVFARLYSKLLDGYLLDALEKLDGVPRSAKRRFRWRDRVRPVLTHHLGGAGPRPAPAGGGSKWAPDLRSRVS